MKKIVAFLLLIASLTLFTACGEGVSRDEAKIATESFITCLLTGDYEGAAALMHSDERVSAEQIEELANALVAYGADFSQTPEYQYTGFKASFYNTRYGGSGYELSGYVIIGECRFELTSVAVRNDNGFGLYGINFSPTANSSQDGEGGSDDAVAAPLVA